MEDGMPRHVQGHDQANTSHYCERCAPLPAKIQRCWTQNSPINITRFIPESLQVDCALCVQFRRVFESKFEKVWPFISYIHIDVQCLLDGPPYGPPEERGKTIGLRFDCVFGQPIVEFYPMQSTEFAYPQVVRRMVDPDEPDYRFIRTQLDRCQRFHGQECVRGMVGKHVLRVIDCHQRRLIIAKPDEPYACLSYVWGGSAAQETPSFGDKLPAEMPKTIEDAMAVAIVLGIPFLWVDRYCIDQKNLQERHNIIQNMNRIYEGAEITIIAACGDDPHYGLPGVQGTPRQPQLSLTLAGTTFVAADAINDEIDNTKWANRGWTYQEMLLSRRRLVFTNTQMYFQCRTTHCMESLYPSFTASSFALRPQFQGFPPNGIGHTVDDLQDRLREYYRRQLSFDTDIINAFKGIISAFDQSESFPFRLTHFYGVLLPYKPDDENLAQRHFITNLSWQAVEKTYPNRFDFQNPPTNLFPSWSWASTKAKSIQGYFSELRPDSLMPYLSRCDQVQVCVTHGTDGDMDLCAFTKHRDSYEMFLPRIKLTTWVVSCPLSRTDNGFLLLGNKYRTEFQPGASCNSLHLAYLDYSGIQYSADFRFFVVALILDEVQPGVFCRIGLWERFMSGVDDAWKSLREARNMALPKARIKATMSVMSFGEEPALLSQWEWRTVTIV